MRRDEGYFSSRDNTRLYWQSTLPDTDAQAFVGVVHGYADHLGRFAGVRDYLAQAGLGVLAFDYRGHGKADGKRGDCEDWSRYIDDLEAFWARLRGLAQGRPTFLLAHSHGALMALHWLLRKPEGLKGLVLTSPYLKLAFEPPALMVLAGKVVGLLVPSLQMKTEFTSEVLSRDLAWQKETDADPLYLRIVTPRWFTQSTAAQEALAGRGKEMTTPTLMLTGSDDRLASAPAARAFFETMGSSDKQYKELPQMRHEPLNEIGKEEVWASIASWISSHR